MVFVSEDIFLDFFAPSDNQKFLYAKSFFESLVNGKVKAFTTTPVLINIADKLAKNYGWKKREIAHNLELILSTPNLKINFRDVLVSALKLYKENNISFPTAYHAEVMKRMGTEVLASNSKEFLKIKNFKKWSDEQ